MKRPSKFTLAGYVMILVFVVALTISFRMWEARNALKGRAYQTQATAGAPSQMPVREMQTPRIRRGRGHEVRPADIHLQVEGAEAEVAVGDADPETDKRPISTMTTFPDEPGIHRVEVDGEILELAVDHTQDVMPAEEAPVDR